MQNKADHESYQSVGVREPPLWSFIPGNCVLIPILHLLLGLGNDVRDNLWEWVAERVEKLEAEEIEARNRSMLTEITLDGKNDKLNDAIIGLEFFVQQLNTELKPRGLARQERDQLTVKKAVMVKEEKEKLVQRNQLDKKVKELCKAHTDAKKMEGEVRKA
jgi:hypothetical protein